MNTFAQSILKENFSPSDIKEHGEEILQQLMWMIQEGQVNFIPPEPRFIPKKIVLTGITHIDYLRDKPSEFGWREIVIKETGQQHFKQYIDPQWFRKVKITIETEEIKHGVQTTSNRG